jgi:precorrin-6A/cobalt-precorrin-6A reductase
MERLLDVRDSKKRILVLGGTGEARRLAELLLGEGYHVITSLAGVTSEPVLPRGEVRLGGFGGVEGMVAFLREAEISAIADATHPFAEQITRHGFKAAEKAKIPYVRVERRPWKPLGREKWTHVGDVEAAVRAVGKDSRVFVAIGRKQLPLFAVRSDLSVLARSIEEPEMELPENWKFIQGRPPFTLNEEKALMAGFKIDTLVCKNAGGKAVSAKLQAARELRIRIIMIERPVIEGIRKVRSIEQALQFLPKRPK